MKQTAISVANTKEAALYYDQVVPLLLFKDIFDDEPHDFVFSRSKAEIVEFVSGMVKSKFRAYINILPSEFREGTDAFNQYLKLTSDCYNIAHNNNDYPEGTLSQHIIKFINFLNQFPLSNAALITSDSEVSDETVNGDEIAITLSEIGLIDASKVSIEKLVAFRKDESAIASLRQLRVFAQTKYDGKSRSFIEDDLLSRVYQYEQTAKKWDFELVNAGLSTLFSSKTAIATIGGTAAAVLAGSPVIATSAALVGTAFEIGKITLSVTKKHFEARETLGNNPVSYIAKARSQLRQ